MTMEIMQKWNSVNPVPNKLLSSLFCTCSRQCVAGTWQCIDKSLHCTDACIKQNCDNMFAEYDEDDDAYDYNYDDQIKNLYDYKRAV